MTENDTHFRNQARELYRETYAAEGDYAGASLAHMARQVDAKLISGMTEAERAWRGVSAPEENKLFPANNEELPELPAYTNGVKASLDSFFVVMGDEEGSVLRSIDIRAVLENEDGLSLLEMALRNLEQKDAEERDAEER
jgi:hypothetical protein